MFHVILLHKVEAVLPVCENFRIKWAFIHVGYNKFPPNMEQWKVEVKVLSEIVQLLCNINLQVFIAPWLNVLNNIFLWENAIIIIIYGNFEPRFRLWKIQEILGVHSGIFSLKHWQHWVVADLAFF